MQNKHPPPLHPLESALNESLAQFFRQHLASQPSDAVAKPPPLIADIILALSGGLDSVVLLHLLIKARQALPFNLVAMHIHHGLSPHANAWADFCVSTCQMLAVPCVVEKVRVDPHTGLGVEAQARLLRYQALFSYHEACQLNTPQTWPSIVLTAHHQDDQAETVLLKLMRGAGVKGLAGMRSVDTAGRLFRPLLDVSRARLLDYANLHHLTWCEDESNLNTAFDRNHMRHAVLPLIKTRFPSVVNSLARTARHMQDTQTLLDDLAAIDACQNEAVDSLQVAQLVALPPARAKNLLRWWLAQRHLLMPSTEQLEAMLVQCLHARADANIALTLRSENAQTMLLKRYQGALYLIPQSHLQDYDTVWNGEPELTLPDGGKLTFAMQVGDGLALKHGIERLRITNKKHGERFKPAANRPTRTLKHLLQEANIPPWRRTHLPLVYRDDMLAYVPMIGAHHALKAQDEMGLVITWHPAF